MKKIFLYPLCLFAAGLPVFAQESSEKIQLPEVTTVITAKDLIVPNDVLPDFEDVIEDQTGSGKINPVLPEIYDETENDEVANVQKPADKSIFAEGKIGGGYPLGIYGDFTIHHLNPKSPFQLSFLHDSAAGYSGTALSEGYNDSTTSFNLDKGFNFENLHTGVNFLYDNNKNGLQNKVENISDVNHNKIGTSADVMWNFTENFALSGNLGFNTYNRYLDVTGTTIPSLWTFNVSPSVALNWQNEHFSAGADLAYDFDYEKSAVHRLSTGLDFGYKNQILNIFSDVHFVFGNALNDNIFIVPFNLGVEANFPVSFATRNFKIFAKGGLDSKRYKLSDYEELYNFVAMDFTPSEVSDWYGILEVTVPVLYSFTGTAKAEYRYTAFGNKFYSPVFDSAYCTNGLYGFDSEERSILVTDIDLSYFYKLFTCNLQWHGNWFYTPVLEDPMSVKLSLSMESEESNWKGSLSAEMGINKDGVSIPIVDLSGFVKLSDSINLVASLNDMVNLFTGNKRIYAGQYIARGGSASVMIKFFF